jgi:hypothetical protein
MCFEDARKGIVVMFLGCEESFSLEFGDAG